MIGRSVRTFPSKGESKKRDRWWQGDWKKGKSKQIVSEMVVDLKIQNLLSHGGQKANLKMI